MDELTFDQFTQELSLIKLAIFYRDELGNTTWGSLHIVLDDHNIEDGSIEFCHAFAMEQRDWVAVQIAEGLLARTTERRIYILEILRQQEFTAEERAEILE